MTSLTDRPNTALLVVDVQRDVVAEAHNRDGVIANITTLVGRARNENVPVIWVQHSSEGMPMGSEGWEYVPELQRGESEPLVHKTYGDSFEDTDLESVLARLGVGRLVVAGPRPTRASAPPCTAHWCAATTLVEDADTTEDLRPWGVPVSPEQVIAHTNSYWSEAKAPGRRGDTTPTAEVDFAAR